MTENKVLQYIYLSVSLVSTFCTLNNVYIIECANLVGGMCFFDLYFIRKRDMMLHHLLVLGFNHYMNTHVDIIHRNEVVSTLLKTEISTIFLITNNLLENKNTSIVKNINKVFFVTTFMYYRIYHYSHLIVDQQINYMYSNRLEYYQLYTCMYGFFMLNLYWYGLILSKVGKPLLFTVWGNLRQPLFQPCVKSN